MKRSCLTDNPIQSMLTFQNPLLLWGLLGLALPVIFHLMNRALFRPLHFPSIRFILKGKFPREKKRRLRDVPLLLLRMLLFTLLLLALARPQWQTEAAVTEEGEEEVIVLVDLSASMGGWDAFPEAEETVENLLRDRPEAQIGMVLSSDRVIRSLPPTREHSLIRQALGEASPEAVAGRHREGIREAIDLFSGQGHQTLVVISDFQESAWQADILPEIHSSVELDWRKVGAADRRENAAILNVRPMPIDGETIRILAEIRNFGESPASRNLQLQIGGQNWTREVDLPPGEIIQVAFTVREPTSSRGELILEGDSFEEDNRYYFWLGQPPPVRVLAIAPLSQEPEKAEEFFFLRRALEARTQGQWLEFAIEGSEPGSSPSDWSPFETVFLLGALPHLTEPEWETLNRFLDEGGEVIATPGRTPAREIGTMRDRGLFTAEFEGVAGLNRRSRDFFTLDWINPESSIGRLFNDDAALAPFLLSIYQYVRMRNGEDGANILIRSSEGDPLLLEKEIGRGRFYLSAIPFDSSWSDLPLSSVFLPLIRELVAGNLPPDHGIRRLDTGVSLDSLNGAASPPNSGTAEIDPRRPGVHLVGNTPVEFNLSRSESVIETTDPLDLHAAARRGRATATGEGSAAAFLSTVAGAATLPLWPWFAAAAAAFFMLEMLLAALLEKKKPAARTPADLAETSTPSTQKP